MAKSSAKPGWAKGYPGQSPTMFSIPIVGTANCGIATIFAETNFQGFLKISNKLVGIDFPDDLYAIKTEGSSMNKAEVKGRKIEDGDYVIVNGKEKDFFNNDIVLAIIDSKATIKRFIDDRIHGQIVLKADSSFDYDPIYLHPDDDFNISGKVVAVVKNPS
jgi:SOS-response transcriptional repressor LexA